MCIRDRILTAAGVLSLLLGGGNGLLIILPLLLAMLVMTIVFAILVNAPTQEGRRLLDEIEGLKRYLSVAERDELKNLPGPDAAPALDACLLYTSRCV